MLKMITQVRDSGEPVILISHNMPHVFEIADRIHTQRLGGYGDVATAWWSLPPTPTATPSRPVGGNGWPT